MRKQITVVFLLCVILLSGCSDTTSKDAQQMITSEPTEEAVSEEINFEEITVLEGENTGEKESVAPLLNIAGEEAIEHIIERKVIPVEEIVYEENDIVFVIDKRYQQRGAKDYGYLILACGKVVQFEVSHEDFFSEKMQEDYRNILNMEKVEPVMELSDDVIQYYIEVFKK